MKKEKSAAVFTIFDAPMMTERGRKLIAIWLKQCADNLVKEGSKYAKVFRARYMYISTKTDKRRN